MDKKILPGYFIWIVLLLFSFSSALAQHPSSEDVKKALLMISEWSDRCEQEVSKLKRRYKPETMKHRRAEDLYIKAKSKSDKWIEILIIDLQMGGKPSGSYQSALEEAANQTAEFLEFVNPPTKGKGKGPSPSPLPISVDEVVRSLTDAGIKIWEAWRKVSREEKEKTIADLKARRWKDFGDIK